MKFLDWYLKIGVVSAMIGVEIPLDLVRCKESWTCSILDAGSRELEPFGIIACSADLYVSSSLWIQADDKVTVLESEKRAWESTPEAQAIREALNPWRDHDKQTRKSS
ncbi:hypothetical protein Sango_2455600 [Sesamum angolense]|uniref:Uncharacterized protein n=1 Tax=Sesamum angolense TaxID=2727404 RepID=A0AAE2BK95_9LAMI|nr:hypothetical protein Sango_2455600 [Sesamum angolense]